MIASCALRKSSVQQARDGGVLWPASTAPRAAILAWLVSNPGTRLQADGAGLEASVGQT